VEIDQKMFLEASAATGSFWSFEKLESSMALESFLSSWKLQEFWETSRAFESFMLIQKFCEALTDKRRQHCVSREETKLNLAPVELVAGEEIDNRMFSCECFSIHQKFTISSFLKAHHASVL
jgi:hypothetical protein